MATSDKNKGFLFTWKIENFSFCYQETGENIESARFVVDNLDKSEWFLLLFPMGDEDDVAGSVSCYLCRSDDKAAPYIVASYKIEMIATSGQVLDSYEEQNVIFRPNDKRGNYHFNKIDEIKSEAENMREDFLIIRCWMYGAIANNLSSTECNTLTKINVYKQFFNWNLEDLAEGYDLREKVLFPDQSRFDIVATKTESDLVIKMFRKNNKCPFSRFLHFKLEIGADTITKKSRLESNRNTMILDFPGVLTKYKTISKICFWIFCSGGVCSGEESYIKKGEADADVSYIKKDEADADVIRNLKDDLGDLFLNKKFCDVKLQVENDIVLAHKVILTARSPVFSAMFEQNMIEAQTGTVQIQDMDVTTLSAFLSFLYSESVDKMDTKLAKDLIIVADKYQVLSLKETCADFLESNLNVKNACEIASLADMVNHARLKSQTVQFITLHYKVIFKTPEWLPWTKNNIELTTEIFARLTNIAAYSELA